MEIIREELQPVDEEEKEHRWKQNYSHFDRMSDEQKKQHMKSLIPVKEHGHTSQP